MVGKVKRTVIKCQDINDKVAVNKTNKKNGGALLLSGDYCYYYFDIIFRKSKSGTKVNVAISPKAVLLRLMKLRMPMLKAVECVILMLW